MSEPFMLDPRLAADTLLLERSDLCQLRLMNDRRWLWLIIVPEIAGAQEWHHLEVQQGGAVNAQVFRAATALECVRPCDKINIASLGNIVRQLHIHVIARCEGDANWPAPVWGYGERIAYGQEELAPLMTALKKAMK